MNEDHIESFLAIMQEGSISKAAKRRFISHQALTKHIDALESELGVRLLTRTPLGCEPTAAGRLFREDIEPVMEGMRRAKQAVRSFAPVGHGTIAVSVNQGFPTPHLDEACHAVSARIPSLQFAFMPMPYDDRVSALRQGIVDLMLCYEVDEVKKDPCLRIWRIEYQDEHTRRASRRCGVLMRDVDPLHSRPLLDLADFEGRTVAVPGSLVYGDLIDRARAAGVEFGVRTLDPCIYPVIEFCNNGGLYVTPEGLWESKALRYVPLDYLIPPPCILTKVDCPPEVDRAAKMIAQEYGGAHIA